MKIDFNPYVLLYTDNVDFYDVYFIIIDEEEKTIDVCDLNGFSIGMIHYKNAKEVGYINYDKNERITDDDKLLIKNGELIYNKEE